MLRIIINNNINIKLRRNAAKKTHRWNSWRRIKVRKITKLTKINYLISIRNKPF